VNRVDRLLAIILYLQGRRSTSVEDLANHFGLSIRTIYRDLIALGEAGVPLVFEPKQGYSILKGYTLPPVNLTETEALALSMGGLLVDQMVDASISQSLESALEKIKSVLPDSTRAQFDKLRTAMAVTALPVEVKQTPISQLQQAISENAVVTFDYQKPGGKNERRTAEPLGLIHYLARWHLIAWCRSKKDYRDFRADRMSNFVMTEEKFTCHNTFDASKFILNSMPVPSLVGVVKFDTVSTDRAKREWWLGIAEETPCEDGSILKLKTVEWLWLARWLLSFSVSATILGPNELSECINAEIDGLLAHYQKR